jgi:hypothetical protein
MEAVISLWSSSIPVSNNFQSVTFVDLIFSRKGKRSYL